MARKLTSAALLRVARLLTRKPRPINKVVEKHAKKVLDPTKTRIRLKRRSSQDQVLVIPIFEEDAQSVHESTGRRFKGKLGEIERVVNDGRVEYIVGLGKKEEFTREKAEKLGAWAVRCGEKEKEVIVGLDLETIVHIVETNGMSREDFAESAATGTILAAYTADRKTGQSDDEKTPEVKKVNFILTGEVRKSIDNGMKLAGCQNTTRYLADLHPGILTPANYEWFVELIAWKRDLLVAKFAPDKLLKMGLGGIDAVGHMAAEHGRLIALLSSDELKDFLAFVGKGIVYDSGGYNIKPTGAMEDMGYDMHGSASVLGAMLRAKQLGIDRPMLTLLAIAANMVGASTKFVGGAEVQLGPYNVEIANTDAEGRIVLSDALNIAKWLQAAVTIEMSTLTGASCVASGWTGDAIGYSMNDELFKLLGEMGAITGDYIHMWKLRPEQLAHYKRKLAKAARSGDFANIAGDKMSGGHHTAFAFLDHFAPEIWAHLDIANAMNAEGIFEEDPRFRGPRLSRGYGVRIGARTALSI